MLKSLEDKFNLYCNSKNFNDLSKKRWVMFNGEIEASKIPSHWHAWLHKTITEPPLDYSHKYHWQKKHVPNMTGTSKKYLPSSHPLSLSNNKNKKIQHDYEKWNP